MKLFLCLLSLVVLGLPRAQAEPVVAGQTLYDLPLEELVRVQVPLQADVGTRDGAHTALHAIVPTDVYTTEQLLSVGEMGLAYALAALVPGFNHPRPSIADGTDHAPPFTLRSLSPDQVLVLVNGKRLHQSSLLHTNSTIGRGSSSVDLNTIPLLAVERVEVLRDGAAAQYGSDAIAGIINIVLKGYGQTNQALLGWGRTTQGDGIQRQASLFHSTALASDGFFNITAELRDRGSSNRARPDADGQTRLHFGDADTQDGQLAWNAELPQGDTTLFSHGHLSRRHSRAGAFFRDADSDKNLPSIYPQGFLPQIAPRITDLSASFGVKGILASGSPWSLAYTAGMNDYRFFVRNSLNRSLGADSPTRFDSGSTAFVQHTLNADVQHNFGPHSLAGGYEYRRADYRIRAGEPASYTLGPDSPWYAGAQGFGGFSPDNATHAQRDSHAVYLDAKYALHPQWTVLGALRAEDYSDFGSTLNGKLAVRFQPTPQWLLRGGLSTGFRAPSLTQTGFTSTSTVLDGSALLQYGHYGVSHPVARALGAQDLKPEKSQHLTFGTVWQPSPQLTASMDGFVTEIDDRIMPTSYIAKSSLAQLSPQAQAILQQYGVEGATYFTNAVRYRSALGLPARPGPWSALASAGSLQLRGHPHYRRERSPFGAGGGYDRSGARPIRARHPGSGPAQAQRQAVEPLQHRAVRPDLQPQLLRQLRQHLRKRQGGLCRPVDAGCPAELPPEQKHHADRGRHQSAQYPAKPVGSDHRPHYWRGQTHCLFPIRALWF